MINSDNPNHDALTVAIAKKTVKAVEEAGLPHETLITLAAIFLDYLKHEKGMSEKAVSLEFQQTMSQLRAHPPRKRKL